jgi:hypothetical protein
VLKTVPEEIKETLTSNGSPELNESSRESTESVSRESMTVEMNREHRTNLWGCVRLASHVDSCVLEFEVRIRAGKNLSIDREYAVCREQDSVAPQ